MLNANLNDIRALLEKTNFKCEILPASDQIPIDQLVVGLGPDEQDRVRYLVIRTAEQDLSSQDTLLGITSSARRYCEIQFHVVLPFRVNIENIPDTARLILLLNKGMELPGFELSEVDQIVLYRHAFVVPEDDLDERIVLSLVGMVQVLLQAFTQPLEIVATGQQSLQAVLESVRQMPNMT